MIQLDTLKTFRGFQNISEEEGKLIINALFQFSMLAYQFFYNQKA